MITKIHNTGGGPQCIAGVVYFHSALVMNNKIHRRYHTAFLVTQQVANSGFIA